MQRFDGVVQMLLRTNHSVQKFALLLDGIYFSLDERPLRLQIFPMLGQRLEGIPSPFQSGNQLFPFRADLTNLRLYRSLVTGVCQSKHLLTSFDQ